MGGIVTAWMELARKMITDGVSTEGISANYLQISTKCQTFFLLVLVLVVEIGF
jgi:hypothetical protein